MPALLALGGVAEVLVLCRGDFGEGKGFLHEQSDKTTIGMEEHEQSDKTTIE